jgi:hypothetical protein
MFDLKLFFGIVIDQEMKAHLEEVSPFLKNALIQNNEDYLQEITFENVTYLGKNLGKFINAQNLDMVEKNIISLLQKLLPNYPFTPLTLFAYYAA